jgi:hypothetical protein
VIAITIPANTNKTISTCIQTQKRGIAANGSGRKIAGGVAAPA